MMFCHGPMPIRNEGERSSALALVTEDLTQLAAPRANVVPRSAPIRRMAAKFEISKDHARKFRLLLRPPNGEIMAAIQGYESKANAEMGIEAIKTRAPGATVEDCTG